MLKIKPDTRLSRFEVEDFLLHDEAKWSMCWGLKGADVGRMSFGNILGCVDLVVHDDQYTLVGCFVIAGNSQSAQIVIYTVATKFV